MTTENSTAIQESEEFLEVAPDAHIEVRTWWTRPGGAHVVVAKGLGGCASRDRLTDELARHYTVHCLSPRAAGRSSGHFTLRGYVDDLTAVCAHVEKSTGSKPLGVGHSFGAFAFAQALGEARVVERVVLLAPLLHILEQNPPGVTAHLRRHVSKGRVPWTLRLFAWGYNTLIRPDSGSGQSARFAIDQQRFPPESVMPFLRSVLDSSECARPLQSPSLVMLTGKTNAGLRIRNLDELASRWRALGAEVQLRAHLNHFMCTGGPFFDSPHTAGLVDDMRAFLDRA